MDRKISVNEKRKAQRKQFLRIGIVISIISGIIVALSFFLEENYTENDFNIGTVDKGSIEITIGANGKFVPSNQEIITSPINSRILEVYKNAGDSVEAGEPLLKLELASVETDYKQKLEEKEIRKRKLEQARGRLNNDLSELEMQRQIKEMNLKQLYNNLISERYLDSIGASTADKVRQTKLAYEEAKLQFSQLNQKIENEKKNAAAELEILELDFSMFLKTLAESERLLNNSRILSPQKATLTFINNQIGQQVTSGAQIAIIADLSRFEIEAEIADSHREKLSYGAKATIKSGEIELEGTVVKISPSVTDGLLTFTVLPDNMDHPGLRSGLKADVYVRYGLSQDVLRIPYRSTYYTFGRGEYDMWVINSGKAVKRRVRLGDRGFNYVEIERGLEEGDKVILTNMEAFAGKSEIKIKNN